MRPNHLSPSRTGIEVEIIFIDDGSTDKSWKVIESLVKLDPPGPRIRFRHNAARPPR